MADSDIIKEFLVALGFKVDDKKLKQFTGGIDTATKFVGKLALGVEAMATAVEVAIVKVSGNFENLYYASKRLNDTVEDIRGWSFAMGQVGSTGKAGLQAMENVAEFLRSYPGGGRFLQGLGVDLKFVNGQAEVTSETMGQLAKAFRAMPYARAKVYAGVLGIDPNTLQAMLRGTDAAQKRADAIFKRMGVDQDKAAEASKNFMNDFRELVLVLTVGIDKIVLAVQPGMERLVKGLEDLDAATDGWSTKLGILVAFLVPLLLVLDPIAVAIVAIGLALTQVDWSQWSSELEGLQKTLVDFADAVNGLGQAMSPVAGWFATAFGPATRGLVSLFLDDVSLGLKILADGIRTVTDLLKGNWKKAWADAGQAAWGDLRDASNARAARQHGRPTTPSAAAAAAAQAPAAVDGTGFDGNNPGNMRRWGNNPVVGGFARFPTALAGLTAMARQLELYSKRGLTTVQSIISTWAPPSDHNDTGAYIRDVAKKLGVNARMQLNLQDPDTLVKLMSAMTTHEHGRNPYGAGLYSNAASAALSRPVVVSQKTDIHVHGSSDPQATAKAVAAEQARVHDAMARGLKSASS